jgi:hypothetical protein
MNNSLRTFRPLTFCAIILWLSFSIVLLNAPSTLNAQSKSVGQKEMSTIGAAAVSFYQQLPSQQASMSPQKVAAVDSRVLNGQGPGSYFGISIASAGDVNGDGYDDVIVGATGYATNTGRAFIFYGGPLMDDVPDVVLTGESPGDRFGFAVAGARDVNGDGYADVIVGAYGYSSYRGRAYIYYGGLHMNMSPDLTFTGEATGVDYGFSVSSAGDVNGDGYADVIVGAYAQGSNQGRAYVYLGGSRMNTIADITMNGETFNTNFGYSVAGAGDVNGDGYDDFVIGAPLHSSGKGRAYIYYGGPGLNSNMDVILSGEAANNLFGLSVSSAGDVNGDGFADVIVGAYGYASTTGRAYIFYGGTPMNTVADITLDAPAPNTWFGISVCHAGDVNGDGFDDVIVGASATSGGIGNAYVYFGGSDMKRGPDITFTGEAVDSDFGHCVYGGGDVNGDGYADVLVSSMRIANNTGRAYIFRNSLRGRDISDIRFTGESQTDNFGAAVSPAGDVNGDGYADILVGAYGKGRAYIYFGGPRMHDSADVVLTGEGSGEFGSAVTCAGDVNGDGYSDVIVSAPTYPPSGRVYVYFGGPHMDNTIDVTLTGEGSGSKFGNSLAAAGDVNGDGYGDMLVGANLYSSNKGRVYIYYGGAVVTSKAGVVLTGSSNTSFGITISGVGDLNADGFDDVAVSEKGKASIFFGGPKIDTTAGLILTDSSMMQIYCIVAGAGDINGDGYADVLVGNPDYDQARGRVLVYLGGSTMDANPDFLFTGEVPVCLYGNYLSTAGDVNGDGYDDVIIGAPYFLKGVGKTYIYFGGPSMKDAADVTMIEADPLLTGSFWGGWARGAGDVNGDGFDDVIVGAPSYNNDMGRVYIYRSSSPPIIPRIASITDEPHDQGGFVNVRWIRSGYDARGISQVTSYRIERSNPPGNIGFAWSPIATIDAGHNPQYSYPAPTPSDSMNGTAGHFFFRVTALTANRDVYWRSNIVSGHSIDNLSPVGVTGGKIFVSIEGCNSLHWNPDRTDSDLQGYVIYRDTTRGIALEKAAQIAVTTDTVYVDAAITKGKVYYYRVAAIDIHGNIGAPTAELSLNATDVRASEGLIPSVFALDQNYPNPFNPSTIIPFALPKSGMVSLRIYNSLGQVVATLVDGHKEAGFHQVQWHSGVPSGIYFYRLQAGDYVETKKMVLLR